ncbi:MAG: sulfatase activating formylglycine-generating enzyme [Candidatus Pelagisphaera sp.]|jgi:formylglycine-generating enzyme required for sulfatase activity
MNKSYISTEWLKPMEEVFVKGRKTRTLPFFDVGVGIDDLQELLRCYVQPLCRYQDHVGNTGKTSCLAFDAVNLFMGAGIDAELRGGNQMLVLGDSGTGKTSLLLLLKLVNDLGVRAGEHSCEYIQIGQDVLDRIGKIQNPSETVLLLDGMDEDISAIEGARQRCLDILEATSGFHRTLISCDNRFFFQNTCDKVEGDGNGRVGEFDCPQMVLLDFDENQVEAYLDNRYPKNWKSMFGKQDLRDLVFERTAALGRLKNRPQLLSLIGHLLGHTESITDEYGLIEAASIQWLIGVSEDSALDGDSGFTIEALYDLVMRMALLMAERDIRILSEEEGEKTLGEGMHQLRLVTLDRDSLLRRIESLDGGCTYRFSHSMVAAFFVAQGILDTSGSDEVVVPEFATNKMIDYIVKGRSNDGEHRDKKLIMRNLKLATFGFEAADLKGAIIEGADLRNANFENADLTNVNFMSCKLDGASFAQANTEGVIPDTPTPGLPVSFEIGDGVFMEMLWVEPGSFNIGNRDTRIDIEIPEGIWLGKFPVTQQQFDVIMETNPSCFKLADGDLPVEQVSWRDAQQFCNELTLLMPEDLEVPLEFRLPKEAEWTHACRAGNETTYGYGDNERLFNEYGWYSGNSGNRTRRVGLKKPNPWGFHDMHGNVWEWCFDRDKRFSLRVLSDLKGKDREEIRAVRGGSWSSLVYACRTTNRNWYPPQETSSNVGFRVALVPRSK